MYFVICGPQGILRYFVIGGTEETLRYFVIGGRGVFIFVVIGDKEKKFIFYEC